jgi:hypothetical protein
MNGDCQTCNVCIVCRTWSDATSSPPQLKRGQPSEAPKGEPDRAKHELRLGGVGQEIESFDQHHPWRYAPPLLS